MTLLKINLQLFKIRISSNQISYFSPSEKSALWSIINSCPLVFSYLYPGLRLSLFYLLCFFLLGVSGFSLSLLDWDSLTLSFKGPYLANDMTVLNSNPFVGLYCALERCYRSCLAFFYAPVPVSSVYQPTFHSSIPPQFVSGEHAFISPLRVPSYCRNVLEPYFDISWNFVSVGDLNIMFIHSLQNMAGSYQPELLLMAQFQAATGDYRWGTVNLAAVKLGHYFFNYGFHYTSLHYLLNSGVFNVPEAPSFITMTPTLAADLTVLDNKGFHMIQYALPQYHPGLTMTEDQTVIKSEVFNLRRSLVAQPSVREIWNFIHSSEIRGPEGTVHPGQVPPSHRALLTVGFNPPKVGVEYQIVYINKANYLEHFNPNRFSD